MSAITTAEVTTLQAYEFGNRTNKSQGLRVLAAIVLSSQGATAGDIPASVFGLKQITSVFCYGSTISSNPRATIFQVASIGSDDNYIYPIALTQATDANRADPANLSGTFYVAVEGIPAP